MSNMWNTGYFINIASEKRVIDSDKRYTASHKSQQTKNRMGDLDSSDDAFTLGIPMEVVEVEPELTPEEILEDAKLEAGQILSEANAHAESLKHDAIVAAQQVYEEQSQAGYAAGLAEGQKQAKMELQTLQTQLYTELQEKSQNLEAEYEQKKSTMEAEIVEAMITVFHKVFHIQLEDKKEILLYLIKNTLMNVDTGKSFRIRVSSENRKFLEDRIVEIQEQIGNDISIEIVNDMGLTEEGCIIETNGGIFHCGIDMQLSNLEKDIRALCI